MPLRLLGYAVRIWERHRLDHPRSVKLPFILPIVFFQDQDAWRYSPQLSDLLDLPEDLEDAWTVRLPRFNHEIPNLSDLALEPLGQHVSLRVLVQVMRAVLLPDSRQAIETGLAALADLARSPDEATFLRTCLTYLFNAGNDLDSEAVFEILSKVQVRELKTEAMTIAETLIAKGRQEGRGEGQRQTLLAVIEMRFGPLPEWASRRVRLATDADIDRWMPHLLDATSLDDLLRS
ncbi:MAG: hypothetical protein EA425_11175 [Puniceicoccaceae bacterium]|nr:MAG: hypothetical protein EA425_11175 [Puniceicoccaceae bacterium]